MTTKKIPSHISKLLNQHKDKWQASQEEILYRVANATKIYHLRLPSIGDLTNHSKVMLLFPTFIKAIECLHDQKYLHFGIDSKNSRATANNYRICFIKPESRMLEEIAELESKVIREYKLELDTIKAEFINELLQDHQKEEELLAAKKQENDFAKLKSELLGLVS